MFNWVSHLVGFALGVGVLVLLVVHGVKAGRPLQVAGFAVYGATLCLLYLTSALYHFFCWLRKIKVATVFQKLDHMAIYLLIAGSYTPICLGVLGGGWRWGLLGAAWGLAVTGLVLRGIIRDPGHPVPFLLYLVMGWMLLVAVAPLSKAMAGPPLWLLLGGGVAYTLGAAIFAARWPRLWPGRFSHHELWHLLVLTGSGLHAAMMFTTLAP